MTWLAVKLFLGKLGGGLIGFVRNNPWQALVIALLCLSAWLWHGKAVALSDLAQCKAARAADHAAYVKAQQEAQAKAIAAKAAAEQHYKDKANDRDEKAAKAVADNRTRAQRYINDPAHRVQPHSASPSGGPAAPADSGGAPRSDGPGGEAELVTVTAGDIQVCTDNTTRLEQAREWALSLGH